VRATRNFSGSEEEGANVRRVRANHGGVDQVEAGAHGAYIDDIERQCKHKTACTKPKRSKHRFEELRFLAEFLIKIPLTAAH